MFCASKEEIKKQEQADADRKRLVADCVQSLSSASAKPVEFKSQLSLLIGDIPCPKIEPTAPETKKKRCGPYSKRPRRNNKKNSSSNGSSSPKHIAEERTIHEALELGFGFGLNHSYTRRQSFHLTTEKIRKYFDNE